MTCSSVALFCDQDPGAKNGSVLYLRLFSWLLSSVNVPLVLWLLSSCLCMFALSHLCFYQSVCRLSICHHLSICLSLNLSPMYRSSGVELLVGVDQDCLSIVLNMAKCQTSFFLIVGPWHPFFLEQTLENLQLYCEYSTPRNLPQQTGSHHFEM